jgi:hypothetical protein
MNKIKCAIVLVAMLNVVAFSGFATNRYGKFDFKSEGFIFSNILTFNKFSKQVDTASDYQRYKKEEEVKIRNNEKTIADLRADLAKDNQANRDKYNQRISKLEQKNNELKKKIEEYKEDKNDSPRWNSFKKDFGKSMDELGQSMKDLVKDYKKK